MIFLGAENGGVRISDDLLGNPPQNYGVSRFQRHKKRHPPEGPTLRGESSTHPPLYPSSAVGLKKEDFPWNNLDLEPLAASHGLNGWLSIG